MKVKTCELNDYEKQINSLGSEIASLYEICGALKEIIRQTKYNPEVYKQFGTFFYMFYRFCYYEIYHGISRLVDDAKGVTSLIKLLAGTKKPDVQRAEIKILEKEVLNGIKNNKTLNKIKNYRNHKLGHKSKELILDDSAESVFREINKLDIEDIEAGLHLLGDALKLASQRASFHVLVLPNTPIRREISNLFELLSAKQSSDLGSPS